MGKLDAYMQVSDMEGNKEQLNDQVGSLTPMAQVESNHNGLKEILLKKLMNQLPMNFMNLLVFILILSPKKSIPGYILKEKIID